MKKIHLQELIRQISQIVLENLGTPLGTPLGSSLSGKDSRIPNSDASDSATDVMTSAEKAKDLRDKEHQRQQQVKQKQSELDSKKKGVDFNKKKLDRQKRVDIPTLNRDIQNLKSSKLEEKSSNNAVSDPTVNIHGKSTGGGHRGSTHDDEFKIKRLRGELSVKQDELAFRHREFQMIQTEIGNLRDELNFLTHKEE